MNAITPSLATGSLKFPGICPEVDTPFAVARGTSAPQALAEVAELLCGAHAILIRVADRDDIELRSCAFLLSAAAALVESLTPIGHGGLSS